MNTKYNVKAKIDGRYFTVGNVQPGQYGPRLGLRASPELRKLLADAADGSWVNLSLFEDDGKFGQAERQTSYAGTGGMGAQAPRHPVEDDSIPF